MSEVQTVENEVQVDISDNATEKLDRKLASFEIIENIRPIPDADAIEVCSIKGWDIVVKKGEFKEGDPCIYVEIDSILPELPEFEFMRPRGFRVKTAKLRKQISQGICFPVTILNSVLTAPLPVEFEVGVDLTEILGIKKYVEKTSFIAAGAKGNFPSFINKTDEERIQNIMGLVNRNKDTDVYVAAKLDGSSYTAFYKQATETKEAEFGVCSRNLLLKAEGSKFGQVTEKYNIEEKLTSYCTVNNVSISIQGEMIGEGVQGNKYRLAGLDLYIFNVFNIDQQRYFNFDELKYFCDSLSLKMVPIIEKPADFVLEKDYLINFATRKSVLNKDVWEEGIVIRSKVEMEGLRGTSAGRFSFKVINPEFLLKY